MVLAQTKGGCPSYLRAAFTIPSTRKVNMNKKFLESLKAYIFIGPFVILSGVFMVYPIIQGFVRSVYNTKWNKTVFVGLENYKKIFSSDIYLLSIKNSLLFVITVVPLLIIFGIWIAGSIFDKKYIYVSAVRACLYIPVIASMVVMSIIWRFILDSQTGLVRYFAMVLGYETAPNLLADRKWTLVLLIVILFTMNIGQTVLLYVADMMGISKDLIEACTIDGGSRQDIFRYVLIPLTAPTTILTFITETSAVLKVFVVIQLLTKGGPNYGTTTMMYLLYQDAFENSNSGTASAMGVLMFMISLILISMRFLVISREKKGEA